MMIAYGPTEDAQIAIGIVVEYGGGGARAGNLMADIFNAYFAMQDGTLNEDGTIGKQETAADSTPLPRLPPLRPKPARIRPQIPPQAPRMLLRRPHLPGRTL